MLFKNKRNLGLMLSSLGGLLVILSFDETDDSQMEMLLTVGGAVLAVAGLVLIMQASRGKKN